MAVIPAKRSCPSESSNNFWNASRHKPGNMNGMMPSMTSIKAKPVSQKFSMALVYFPDLLVLLRYLKNEELGSITITSLLLVKLFL